MKKDHAEMGVTKCDICETSFNTTTILHLHVENVHKGQVEKKFQCGICDKTFEIKIELRQHQNSVHGSDSVDNALPLLISLNYSKRFLIMYNWIARIKASIIQNHFMFSIQVQIIKALKRLIGKVLDKDKILD